MKNVRVNSSNVRAISASKKTGSFNRETRTFSAVFVTETPVYRYGEIDGRWQRFREILSCDPAHVQSDRLVDGVAFLDSHNKYGISAQIGHIRNLSVQDKKITGDVLLSRRPELETLMNDLEDGIVRNISVGYNVFKYQDVTKQGESIRTLKAVDWEMFEGSVLPVQADPRASVRSIEDKSLLTNVEILTRNMDENENAPTEVVTEAPVAQAPAPAAVVAPTVATSGERSIATERQRSAEIMRLGRAAHFEDTAIQTAIADGTSIENFRGMVLESMLSRDPGQQNPNVPAPQQRSIATQSAPATPVQTQRSQPPVVTRDGLDNVRSLMELGLDLKLGIQNETEVTDFNQVVAADRYRSMSATGLIRTINHLKGHDVATLNDNELCDLVLQPGQRGVISSSTFDFPELLSGLARRTLLKDWKIISDVWRKFCKIGSVSDFREWKRLHGGSITNLEMVDENGEYPTGKLPDAKPESVKIDTYGKIINVTRRMLINDDLGAFQDNTRKLIRASARTIEMAFFTLLETNPNMADGQPLFSAAHGNLVSPGVAFGPAGLKAMRNKIEAQKDLSNNDFLDLTLDRLLVPLSLYDDALLLNTSPWADETGKFQKKNIYNGMFDIVEKSPRLTNQTAHYAFTDPDVEPVFEMTFLDGKQTPYLEEKAEFNVDGIRWKIRHDWGVNAVGWKGAVKNLGA